MVILSTSGNSENLFPKTHLKVIQKIISLATKGTKVYYITGNHDEMLRKFSDMNMGNFALVDKLVLNLMTKKPGFFMATYSMPPYSMRNGLPRWVV
jgi:UDP-2,3-diacylglucosamine pyrophosphatase LpxH